MNKNVLFIMRRAPHAGNHAHETLDAVMTVAAFDQSVRVLFVDDGVFQLKKDQDPAAIGLKHVAPWFQALRIYGVHELFVEAESLSERSLGEDDLSLPVQLLQRDQIAGLLGSQDVILTS